MKRNSQHYKKSIVINTSVETLFEWHSRQGAIQRLTPPWIELEIISHDGNCIQQGSKIEFQIKLFRFSIAWTALHTHYVKNYLFRDIQTRGPFALWEHTHRFIPLSPRNAIIEDDIRFKLPLKKLTHYFYPIVKKELSRMIAYRHRVLKHDIEYCQNSIYQKSTKKRILISGSSGVIGSALVPFLQTRGYEVIRLVRDNKKKLASKEIFWNPYSNNLDLDKIGRIDAVINLNGLDISKKRWGRGQKKKIMDSRILSTRLLVRKISSLSQKPRVFISSSAIGYYGNVTDTYIDETFPCGNSFISNVCHQWEVETIPAYNAGIRTVCLRTGVVLTPAGGTLKRMKIPFQLGFGAKIADGNQMLSWICMDDALWAIYHILENDSLHGPVNLTAPYPVTNFVFVKTLSKLFGKRIFFTLPGFMIEALLGQMGRELLISGAGILPKKLMDSGFSFRYPQLLESLKHLLGR